ncbi:MAG: hypothetical protein CMJ20_11085 [Phycisphaeraceae bacterium]|nr:hypothetical protein [Phycisphaeraceae bacterium]
MHPQEPQFPNPSPIPTPVFDVRSYGAVGDGHSLDTQPIQETIDTCSRQGGGTVIFPDGVYLSGTILLRSRVTLHLSTGATLLGSSDIQQYIPHTPATRSVINDQNDKSLIYAENESHIAITGHGIIDGQGSEFIHVPIRQHKQRPFVLRFAQCRHITIQNVTFKGGAMWTQWYLACHDINIDGIHVHSRTIGNNDGLNIDGCDHTRINNCHIDSKDDCIVFKSTSNHMTTNATVSNCTLTSDTNALKFGTESYGGFKNISITNCIVHHTKKSGVDLRIIDGGTIDGVTISNIIMSNVGVPIHICLGNIPRHFRSKSKTAQPGFIRNIQLNNIQATKAGPAGCAIVGLPTRPIENISLNQINLEFTGGGQVHDDTLTNIQEAGQQYTSYWVNSTPPAYGLLVRYVNNLQVDGIQLRYTGKEDRCPMILNHIHRADIRQVWADRSTSARAMIWLNQATETSIQECRCSESPEPVVRIDGGKSHEIRISKQAPTQHSRPVSTGDDVPGNAVKEMPQES